MKQSVKRVLTTLLLLSCCVFSSEAQYTTLNAHSHNDYNNSIPFWIAYYNHFGSIEADIWAVGDDLLVAHDKEDLTPERSLYKLYIEPAVKLVRHNGGKAWSDYPSSFQFIIELKSGTEPTLSMLVKMVEEYPDVFNPDINENAIRIVITGRIPDPADFCKYPCYLTFDGDLKIKYTKKQLEQVILFSNDLEYFTFWKGDSTMPIKDYKRLKQVIDSVHIAGKKIRFWNAPDNELSWETLINLGVDYVNTDFINELAAYMNRRAVILE